ncbi:MAG: hypothetical protein Q8Q87_00750 [Candidatus Omnitrophota bacterium]|nr:hypothetical protein [Candidatus Omnitrophota bacterium]
MMIKNNERRKSVSKNMKSILAGLAIFIIGLLVISCYSADLKVKQSEKQIAALNDLIKEKDGAINKLMGEMQSKQQELDSVKQELNSARQELGNVKTELSNAVVRIQSAAPAPATPANVPVKKPVRPPAKK